MTRRFPHTETPLPDDLRDRLINNGRIAEGRDSFDPCPVVKLFAPDADATWLISETYPEDFCRHHIP